MRNEPFLDQNNDYTAISNGLVLNGTKVLMLVAFMVRTVNQKDSKYINSTSRLS